MTASDAPHDPFETYDAAYVLGALTESDRAAYVAHLETCERCRDAVARLWALPKLLARVPSVDAPIGLVPDDAGVPPMPETLLPGLLARVRRTRRRTRLATGVAGVAAAACLVTGTALVVDHDPAQNGQVVSLSTPASVPLQASLRMQDKIWGTELTMQCRYIGYVSSEAKTYELVVVPKAGGAPQTIARWKVVPDHDATVTGSTELTASQIGQVQVRTENGTVVLSS